jgi:thymidine kinase
MPDAGRTADPQARPAQGRLRFYGGVMGAGKSALALQLAHHRRAAGRAGLLLTSQDRAGSGQLSSRLGITAAAREFAADTDLFALLTESVPPRGFAIVDEAQFCHLPGAVPTALAYRRPGPDHR